MEDKKIGRKIFIKIRVRDFLKEDVAFKIHEALELFYFTLKQLKSKQLLNNKEEENYRIIYDFADIKIIDKDIFLGVIINKLYELTINNHIPIKIFEESISFLNLNETYKTYIDDLMTAKINHLNKNNKG